MDPEIKRRKAREYYPKVREIQIARRKVWYTENRDASLAKSAAYYRANREKLIEKQQIRLYGETRAAVIARLGARCGCCGTTDEPPRRGWQVDHDHLTGRVRGILCVTCNTGIGKLGDSIEGIERALAYLRRAK